MPRSHIFINKPIISASYRALLVGLVLAAASIAMSTLLALSFLIAAFTRNAINVVVASVAVYLMLYLISEVHFVRDLRPLLFPSHIGYWRGVFLQDIDWPLLMRDPSKMISFMFVFLAIAGYGRSGAEYSSDALTPRLVIWNVSGATGWRPSAERRTGSVRGYRFETARS